MYSGPRVTCTTTLCFHWRENYVQKGWSPSTQSLCLIWSAYWCTWNLGPFWYVNWFLKEVCPGRTMPSCRRHSPQGLFDCPVSPAEMLHHLQGRDLAETCQLILNGGEEYRLDVLDDLFLYWVVDGSVSSEKSLFMFEPLCCNYVFWFCFQGGRLVAWVMGGGKGVARLVKIIFCGHRMG